MEVLKKTILQAVTTGITQGYWNAATNVPNVSTSVGIRYMWYVSVAGNTSLGGIDEWNIGDWAVKYINGWGRVINGVSGSTGEILTIPDLDVIYYTKIGLKQDTHDVGFFDAYIEPPEPPPPPEPPVVTFYLTDNNAANVLVDNNNDIFIYE